MVVGNAPQRPPGQGGATALRIDHLGNYEILSNCIDVLLLIDIAFDCPCLPVVKRVRLAMRIFEIKL